MITITTSRSWHLGKWITFSIIPEARPKVFTMEDTEQDTADQSNANEASNIECVGDVCPIPTPTLQPKDKKKKKTGSSSAFIKTLHSEQDLSALLESNEAVIVEFLASWCGACAAIEPLYEELAESAAASEGQGPQSAQVISDKNKETKKMAANVSVGSYPVFVVFENGNETGRWNGADRGKLEKAFDRLGQGRGGRGGMGGKKKGKGRK
jgi:thiol-disulfide isomerase/thioredoxin